jgi:FKBP-type peptidyl-prolyl cis-trans isomerase
MMKRRTAVMALAGLAVPGFLTFMPGLVGTPALAQAAAAPPAPAANDALSIDANQRYLEESKAKKGTIVRPSGLQFRILQNGFGKRPQPTDTVKVYYTGRLINGTIFDGTSPGLPASFKLNNVIPGWIEALQLMREGDHWALVIPPQLGYGVRGSGGGLIPPNQVLLFDVRLLGTTPAPRRGDKDYVPDASERDER